MHKHVVHGLRMNWRGPVTGNKGYMGEELQYLVCMSVRVSYECDLINACIQDPQTPPRITRLHLAWSHLCGTI